MRGFMAGEHGRILGKWGGLDRAALARFAVESPPLGRTSEKRLGKRSRRVTMILFKSSVMFFDQSDTEADGTLPGFAAWRPASVDCGDGAILAPSENWMGSDEDASSAEAGEPVQPQRAYERELIQSVWEFAEVVPGSDPALWRRDELGSWIYRYDYGRRSSSYGWEVFDPGRGRQAQGIYAMRPLQWENYVRQYEALA